MDKIGAYCVYINLKKQQGSKCQCTHPTYGGKWSDKYCSPVSYCDKWCGRCHWDEIDESNEFMKNYKGDKQENSSYTSVGCYITTIVVNILGFADNCEELNTLRWFRQEIMAKDEHYRDLLMQYDILGPNLAHVISTLPNAYEIAVDLYKIYIRGCINYIKSEQFDYAVLLYSEMMQRLIANYMLSTPTIGAEAQKNYNQEAGGHGAFRMMPKKKKND